MQGGPRVQPIQSPIEQLGAPSLDTIPEVPRSFSNLPPSQPVEYPNPIIEGGYGTQSPVSGGKGDFLSMSRNNPGKADLIGMRKPDLISLNPGDAPSNLNFETLHNMGGGNPPLDPGAPIEVADSKIFTDPGIQGEIPTDPGAGVRPGDTQAPISDTKAEIKSAFDPKKTLDASLKFMKDNPMLALGGLALISQMGQGDSGNKKPKKEGAKESFPEFETATPPADYQPGLDPEFLMFNHTGKTGMTPPMDVKPETVDAAMNKALLAIEGKTENPELDLEMLRRIIGDEAFDEFMEIFVGAEGPEQTQGGGIGGLGGGASDTIPATIDGGEPANLSSGEYVVPADVVSHVGDGNSNAGMAALDGIIGNVRQMKTGNQQMPGRLGLV
jgi:hypothetical protein